MSGDDERQPAMVTDLGIAPESQAAIEEVIRMTRERLAATPPPAVCTECGMGERYMHHESVGTKGYHPFAPPSRGGSDTKGSNDGR